MLGMSNTPKLQFERIRKRVSTIINGKSQSKSINCEPSKKWKCVIEVFKRQNGLAARIFNEYFKILQHQKNVCGNSSSVLLPKVCTEADHKSFLFQAWKLFNKLPDILKKKDLW